MHIHRTYRLVSSVAVSADGRFIVSGSGDKTIKVWNILERREECTFTGHTDFVSSVAVSADGRFIVSGSEDKTIKVWNILERREECTFSNLTQIQRIALSADGKFIICKGTDCVVKILNRKTMKKESFSLQKHQGLLKYILEIVEIVNCQVIAIQDLLLLVSGSWVVHTALIKNGDLNFSFDLGVNSSKNIHLDHIFLNHVRVAEPLTIISTVADRYNGMLRFNLAHYFSYSGSANKLKLLIEHDNFVIGVDAFGKSPFHYAIVKKRQDCVDILLEKIEFMRLKNKKNYDLSIWAIRNDISLIIKNSPRQLHQLLSCLISSSKLIYAKIPGNYQSYN